MIKLSKEISDKILYNSGVVVFDNSENFENYFQKICEVFLTPENKKWFDELNSKFPNENSSSKLVCQKPDYLFWELFSYKKLSALKNDDAIDCFNSSEIKDCYLLQFPDYAKDDGSKILYRLKGLYDVSFVKDEYEFTLLKAEIKKDVSIPYWVIDKISKETGCGETYVFDDSFSWFCILTHENSIYFYTVD